jgi:hypothetical protein
MRLISTKGYTFAKPATLGPKPELAWIPIAQLVVDDRYQRPIMRSGRATIERIAAGFDWRKFSPVIVARLPESRYAIIDGQHRATAADLNGQPSVPCSIIKAETREQAQAFASINGNVTKLHSLQIYHAALAGGDEKAAQVARVTAAAGVSICRYPLPAAKMERGQTIAPRLFFDLIKQHGEDIVVAALKGIVDAAAGNAGLLKGHVIPAYCDVFARRPDLAGHSGLLDALDDFDLQHHADQALIAKRARGVPAWRPLAAALETYLADTLARRAA